MKKYFAFMKVVFKEQLAKLTDEIGTLFSFCIHILVFSALWDFVLEGKTLANYTKQDLIWYVIIAEIILYSFHNFYRKVSYKIEMGDFAYDMSKPYNFLLRSIFEGIAELPLTIIILIIGVVLGIILAGPINITLFSVIGSLIVILLASLLHLTLNIVVGLLTIWLGRDVSSVWLLVSKAMLIFAFSPIELFPKGLQPILMALPTTHVIYTPASLFVHFNMENFLFAVFCEMIALLVVAGILTILYMKGVKKQNVNGI